MNTEPEFAVTLSADLYCQLLAEARRLGIALEWLVASLVVDTMGDKVEERGRVMMIG
jgi:hypothetical protein